MFLIIDVNVIISSLFSKGNSFDVFFLNLIQKKFSFFAPEYLLEELEKHKQEVIQRTQLPESIIEKDIEFILDQITFVPKSEYGHNLAEARKMLQGNEKDVPYLALALEKNCHIFSGDKGLKKLIPDKVKTPREMIDEFRSYIA